MKAFEKHDSNKTSEEQDLLNSVDIDFFDMLMYRDGLLPAVDIREAKTYYEIDISAVNLYQPSMEFETNATINTLSVSFLMTRGLTLYNHYYYLSVKRHFGLPVDIQLETLEHIHENGFVRFKINKTKEKNLFKRIASELEWYWKSTYRMLQKLFRRTTNSAGHFAD